MAILNYTTSVPADRSVHEIHKILSKAGADAINNEYSKGRTVALAFRITTPQGIIYYKLPADVRGVKASMIRDNVKHKDMDAQAERIAWRIIKDWIEAQMAIIQANMAALSQVFLPYAMTETGQTVYEKFEKGGVGVLGITYQKGGE